MKKELDLDFVSIYTKDDVIHAMTLLGQEVYMSDDIYFKDYYENTLSAIQITQDFTRPFIGVDSTGFEQLYKYFILKKDVKFKDKKLRPFKDTKEFRHILGVKVGNIVHYREKGSSLEYNLMWTGYTNDKLVVIFGGTFHSLNSLFERYEYCDSKGEWHPFGVEE